VLRGHDNAVPVLVSSPDGKHLVSGSLDKTVRFWDWDSASTSVSAAAPTLSIPQSVPMLSAAFSPAGDIMAGGTFDGAVRILDVWKRNVLVGSLTGQKDRVLCVALSPTNQYLASGSTDGTLQVWDWQTRKGADTRVGILRGFESGASCAVFSHDAELLIAGAVNGRIS